MGRGPMWSAASVDDYGDLGPQRSTAQGEVVAAPELAWVIPVRRSVGIEKTHSFVTDGNEFGAVEILELDPSTDPAEQPVFDESSGAREPSTVELLDRSQSGVFHFGRRRYVDLAEVRVLSVTIAPYAHSVFEKVKLSSSLMCSTPGVRQGTSEFGMPEKWGKIIDGDHHGHVVHRAVGCSSDCPIGSCWSYRGCGSRRVFSQTKPGLEELRRRRNPGSSTHQVGRSRLSGQPADFRVEPAPESGPASINSAKRAFG